MQYKAICFDLDGTLLDSLADLAMTTNEVLSKRGFPTHKISEYRYFVGDGSKSLISRALPKGSRDKDIIKDCQNEFESIYRKNLFRNTSLYKDVPKLLDELSKNDFKLSILSNKPHELTIMAVESLLQNWKFEVVLGQCNNILKKPNPDGFFIICKRMKLPITSFIFLGDSGTDMETAVAAGCRPVGALWGFRNENELINKGASATINSPLELLELLN